MCLFVGASLQIPIAPTDVTINHILTAKVEKASRSEGVTIRVYVNVERAEAA